MTKKLVKETNFVPKDESPFIPNDVREDIVDGTAKVGRVTAFFLTNLVNATAKVIGNGVAYAGRVVEKSEQNSNLVHQVGHQALATKHCVHCGTQLIAVAKFCSNCGQKQ